MSLYLLPLAGWSLSFIIFESNRYFKNKPTLSRIAAAFALTIFLWFPALVSLQFAINPKIAQIAKADSSQYVNSWAAGWGVKESLTFFRNQAVNQKIFIATEGTFGLLPESMEMYLIDNKNITIKGFWPVDKFPKEALDFSKKMPSYFIFYQKEHINIPSNFPLKLLFKVKQGNSDTFYRVYQIIP